MSHTKQPLKHPIYTSYWKTCYIIAAAQESTTEMRTDAPETETLFCTHDAVAMCSIP
jgi:hypothetical protein